MRRTPFICLVFLSGCWKVDANTLSSNEIAYAPINQVFLESGEAVPAGWLINTYEMPLLCPDGENAELFLLYPKDASGPVPLAVFFHSGAFDYVLEPTEEDPLGTEHFQRGSGNAFSSRLEREWAAHQVFATLGMWPDSDPIETHAGALPMAFVESKTAVLLPENCWGDLWHNSSALSKTNAPEEFFSREGLAAAKWTWEVASGVLNADLSFPVDFDPSRLYLVGQGEGGRAVTELLARGAQPAGVIIDSTADDLSAYWDNLGVHALRITGLERIWTGGVDSMLAGSLGLLEVAPDVPVAYLYSSLDSRVPRKAHRNAISLLSGDPDLVTSGVDILSPTRLLRDTSQTVHVTTASDFALAREVVGFVTQ